MYELFSDGYILISSKFRTPMVPSDLAIYPFVFAIGRRFLHKLLGIALLTDILNKHFCSLSGSSVNNYLNQSSADNLRLQWVFLTIITDLLGLTPRIGISMAVIIVVKSPYPAGQLKFTFIVFTVLLWYDQ